jgi:hypothetical protein
MHPPARLTLPPVQSGRMTRMLSGDATIPLSALSFGLYQPGELQARPTGGDAAQVFKVRGLGRGAVGEAGGRAPPAATRRGCSSCAAAPEPSPRVWAPGRRGQAGGRANGAAAGARLAAATGSLASCRASSHAPHLHRAAQGERFGRSNTYIISTPFRLEEAGVEGVSHAIATYHPGGVWPSAGQGLE